MAPGTAETVTLTVGAVTFFENAWRRANEPL
jgi:hypothetical protein